MRKEEAKVIGKIAIIAKRDLALRLIEQFFREMAHIGATEE